MFFGEPDSNKHKALPTWPVPEKVDQWLSTSHGVTYKCSTTACQALHLAIYIHSILKTCCSRFYSCFTGHGTGLENCICTNVNREWRVPGRLKVPM